MYVPCKDCGHFCTASCTFPLSQYPCVYYTGKMPSGEMLYAKNVCPLRPAELHDNTETQGPELGMG